MKIRIKGDSVRYRLSKTDVAAITGKGYHEEQTRFAGSTLTYTLQQHADSEQLSATYTDNRITLFIPATFLKDWATNDVVGIEGHMPTEEGRSLYLLVEKDFICLDETTEDQSDNYANPNQTC